MKTAKLYVGAVNVACPCCGTLQSINGNPSVPADHLFVLDPLDHLGQTYYEGARMCEACGENMKLPALKDSIPLTSADER